MNKNISPKKKNLRNKLTTNSDRTTNLIGAQFRSDRIIFFHVLSIYRQI